MSPALKYDKVYVHCTICLRWTLVGTNCNTTVWIANKHAFQIFWVLFIHWTKLLLNCDPYTEKHTDCAQLHPCLTVCKLNSLCNNFFNVVSHIVGIGTDF